MRATILGPAAGLALVLMTSRQLTEEQRDRRVWVMAALVIAAACWQEEPTK